MGAAFFIYNLNAVIHWNVILWHGIYIDLDLSRSGCWQSMKAVALIEPSFWPAHAGTGVSILLIEPSFWPANAGTRVNITPP